MFLLKYPSNKLIIESFKVYNDAYINCLKEGIRSEEDIIKDIEKRGLFTEFDQLEYLKEVSQKEIQKFHRKKYSCQELNYIYNIIIEGKEEVEELRVNYTINQEYQELYEQLSQYIHISAEEIAYKEKILFLIQKCVEPLKDIESMIIYFPYFLNKIRDAGFRQIARGEEEAGHNWSTRWRISEGRDIFGKSIIELDDNKIKLCEWSWIYDQIRQSYEPPEDNVIKDDALFDAWMKFKPSKKDYGNKQVETFYGGVD